MTELPLIDLSIILLSFILLIGLALYLGKGSEQHKRLFFR